MTFPMFMDDDDETAQEREEFTFPEEEEVQQEIMERRQDNLPSFEEPLQIIKKENENFVESYEDHKEGRQEAEISNIEKSAGVHPLTHKTNFVLVDDSSVFRNRLMVSIDFWPF
ncbi:hypothetical protein M9H77_02990 [Catharanthus roseus]|uniref:Uncharacterized protein n=1 Tax=Catharanthus roseus TaxID=4058 RepID=A0ACC0CA91_CATRO|nr:hypothetical protein M9H77_02990 [Catharanthus roseus]